MNLSTQPYKGARDFYPKDQEIQNYMISKITNVCLKHGFSEYNFPILEPFEIFAKKSGEEIVNNQIFTLTDAKGRKLAIRPELTPGTVRLIAQKYKELNKPLKWFMVGNNWRYEAPQRGRGREFNQVEVNIFGEKSILADFQIFEIIIDILTEFGATEKMFSLRYNDRKIINLLLMNNLGLENEIATKVRRVMDSYNKLTRDEFNQQLLNLNLKKPQIDHIENFLKADFDDLDSIFNHNELEKNTGYQALMSLRKLLTMFNLDKYCAFDPTIIRGFDYSDGLVYEVLDKSPKNKRSLFGGERFDNLINIFADYELPATGFALGDYTLRLFLEEWNLLPNLKHRKNYFVSVWPIDKNDTVNNMTYYEISSKIAKFLRSKGNRVFLFTNNHTKIEKQLKLADRENYKYFVIVGENEIKNNEYVVKDLETSEQKTYPLNF